MVVTYRFARMPVNDGLIDVVSGWWGEGRLVGMVVKGGTGCLGGVGRRS